MDEEERVSTRAWVCITPKFPVSELTQLCDNLSSNYSFWLTFWAFTGEEKRIDL